MAGQSRFVGMLVTFAAALFACTMTGCGCGGRIAAPWVDDTAQDVGEDIADARDEDGDEAGGGEGA